MDYKESIMFSSGRFDGRYFRCLFFVTVVFLLLSTFHSPSALANNLQISNVSLEERDTGADTVVIEFDISWDNSWRNSINYDAVWVFLKVCKGEACSPLANVAWVHGMLNTAGINSADIDSGDNADLRIEIPDDRVGAFLYRKTTGAGTMSSNNVRLTMDYSEAPLSAGDTDNIQVKVFGIEMVYIPQGDFYIGDGDGTNESTYAFHVTDNTAVQITSAMTGSVTVDTSTNDDIDTSPIRIDGDGGIDTDNDGTVDNASFPTGWGSFYLMKYELTQGQYRDFLNTLTREQQNSSASNNRVATLATASDYAMTDAATVTARDTIRLPATLAGGSLPETFGCDYAANSSSGDGTFDQADDGEWIAMNYLSWMDLAAYADWAGLRPMTELEFEKAARGPVSAVYGEYAWGSTDLTQAEGAVVNAGRDTELPASAGSGLSNYNGSGTDIAGPLRAGFAAASSTNRIQAGAGYYGVMELSGNLFERVVTVGNATGRSFKGTHGDGVLTTTALYQGNATNSDWPGIDGTAARGLTGAAGSGLRGGAWNQTTTLAISNRNDAANTLSSRAASFGGRLVRTGNPKNYVTVLYVTTATHNGDFYTASSDARSSLDDFCTSNQPANLPSGCINHHAFISLDYLSTDTISDMPNTYFYLEDLPIYWWHDTNQAYTMLATDWADMLDGTIAVSQTTGTGSSAEVWTGSDEYGDADMGNLCSGYSMSSWEDGTSGMGGRTGTAGATGSDWLSYTAGVAPCDYSASLRCACQIDVNE